MLSSHFLDSLQSPQWGWTGWSLHCRTSKHLSLAQDLEYPGRKRVAFGPGLLWLQNGRWASALPCSVWGPWGLKIQMASLLTDCLSLCRGVGVWPPHLGIWCWLDLEVRVLVHPPSPGWAAETSRPSSPGGGLACTELQEKFP